MIRVAALTGSRDDPSSRFRVRQFVAPLARRGIQVAELRPWVSKFAGAPWQLTGLGAAARAVHALAARRHDLAWLNRELVTGRATIERFAGRRRILDVDDAIWLHGRAGFARRIAARCDGVIAGNEWIAEYFQPAARRLWIVPTVVDTGVWKPALPAPPAHSLAPVAGAEPPPPAGAPPAPGPAAESFTLAWSGSRWNLPYLYAIEAPLARFLADHPAASLLVVCDRRPEMHLLPAARVRFMRWSPAIEVAALQGASVGLAPLPDDEWTRAKCATKMLCAMAVGLPVVASPVGVAAGILGNAAVGVAARCAGDWYEALAHLLAHPDERRAMGAAGRQLVEQGYSVASTVDRLAAIFREVAQG